MASLENDLEQKKEAIKDTLLNLSELQKGKGLWQNKWHQHDVYDHSVEVARIIEESNPADLELLAAACVHDIGKPATAKPRYDKQGNILLHPISHEQAHSFHGHEKQGEAIVRGLPDNLFAGWGISKDTVAKLVGSHFIPMAYVHNMQAVEDLDLKTFSKILVRLGKALDDTGIKDKILILFYADKAAQGKRMDFEFLRQLTEYLEGKKISIEQLFASFKENYQQ